jgi:leucyl-tRNA synthetase
MMELLNSLYKYDSDTAEKNLGFLEEVVSTLIRLLAPFAPHFAEEMWEKLGYSYSIFNQPWPKFEQSALVKDVVELGVQVNGKVRAKIEVPSDMSNEDIEKTVLADNNIISLFDGKSVKKVIIVKGRLVNIVVG